MFLEKMDDLFGMLGGSLRSSITDSTMMWIVHYAMDKAHGKVKSNGGILQRLNEISKFYELAVIQLEGCMRFVQEEADGGILESCHEKVLADLTEIRDRLLGRLKESELAILDKDQELLERFENELKLRQALELKEKELASLNVVELTGGVSKTEDRDGEFCELMQSVDQQVLNIKQQLDQPDCSLVDEERNRGVDNKKIEQMGFDIHILKETMDHAFGKMQDAIFLSELRPQEKKWRWTIEKETIGTLIKGFLMDFKENFEVEMKKQGKQDSTGLSEHMSHLIKEATCLRNELESLIDLNEPQPTNSSNPPKAMSLSKGDSIDSSNILSSKVDEDEPENDGSHVAKMIKSHESIIRKKSEELNWLKREILSEKGCSSSRNEKNPVSLKGRILDVIVRLDNLIDCNSKLVENFGGDQESDAKHGENPGTKGLEDVWEKMKSFSVSQLHNEIRMLKQEKEDGNLVAMIMEETSATIFRGLISEFYTELHAHSLESLIKECTYEDFIKEMINEWKEDAESSQIGTQTREEVYYIVCNETVKDFCSALDCLLADFQDEYALGEDVSTVLFREMYDEWNETLIRENLCQIVLDEFIRDIVNNANYTLSEREEARVAENFMFGSALSIKSCEIAEYSVKEEVYMVFFRQVIDECNACNIERLIRDELHQFILIEAVKEASLSFMELSEHKIFQKSLNEDETSTLTSVRGKPEKVEERLAMSKMVLSELGFILATEVDDRERVHDNAEFYINQSDSIFTPVLEFPQVFVNFEILAHQKLGNNLLRLEEMKHQIDSLAELVGSTQKREFLYREAFIRRCQNLQKAETEVLKKKTEVDLLGDQVDVLVGLLETIYRTLHQHSPLLQQHFEVSEILKLIQRELAGEVHGSGKR